jgi:hypothetical protein
MNVTASQGKDKEAKYSIEQILEQETNRNSKETWTKLDKTTKIQRLTDYAKCFGNEKGLSDDETKELARYLADALERKRLSSVKEVIYNNVECKIIKIPCLSLSSTGNKKYTLKRMEKRTSTLKALGPGKTNKKTDKIDIVIK